MGLISTTNNYHRSTSYAVPYEKTVIEKKAPTDESIRLLNEFQEKARENLLQQILIDDNILRGVIVAQMLPGFSTAQNDTIYMVKFTLNGKEHNFEIRSNKYGLIKDANHEVVKELYKRFSEAIAIELLKQSTHIWERANI